MTGVQTCALPISRLGVPVAERRWDATGSAARESRQGDLIISQPEIWRYTTRVKRDWNPGVWGVSSTAPLGPQVHRSLRAAGLERLFEVYGSTETGGVGLREEPDAPFYLFPYLERKISAESREADESTLVRIYSDGKREEVLLPDHVEWHGPRQFIPRGRNDRVVQVGGHNVNLDRVERILSSVPGVSSASVQPREVDDSTRIAAALIPEPGGSPEQIREGAEEIVRTRLVPVERPTVITIAEGPPVDSTP